MGATTEKIKPTEARGPVTLPRPKRPLPRVAGSESLRQQFHWRELNLVSTARALRHWHD